MSNGRNHLDQYFRGYLEGSGRTTWHKTASSELKYPVPTHWPANNPLPANYYPKEVPPGYVSQLHPSVNGVIGILGTYKKVVSVAKPSDSEKSNARKIYRQPYGIPTEFTGYYQENI